MTIQEGLSAFERRMDDGGGEADVAAACAALAEVVAEHGEAAMAVARESYPGVVEPAWDAMLAVGRGEKPPRFLLLDREQAERSSTWEAGRLADALSGVEALVDGVVKTLPLCAMRKGMVAQVFETDGTPKGVDAQREWLTGRGMTIPAEPPEDPPAWRRIMDRPRDLDATLLKTGLAAMPSVLSMRREACG